jgi:hypothetical protein
MCAVVGPDAVRRDLGCGGCGAGRDVGAAGSGELEEGVDCRFQGAGVPQGLGHLQLVNAPRIAGVNVAVSVDGGRNWRAAQLARCGARCFRATFTAPSGAYVTLRTIATDAAQGQISETIARAYRTS